MNHTFQSPLLMDYAGDLRIPDLAHIEHSSTSSDKTDRKHTVPSAAEPPFRTVERVLDGFPLLKSVAAGLCAISHNTPRYILSSWLVQELALLRRDKF